jgi:two-component system, NtrC family, sensor kinase
MKTTTSIVRSKSGAGQEPSFSDHFDLPASAKALRENHKMVTIGRLAGSIAHEINNPLESITNLMFLIASDPKLSNESRNYLQMAQHELNRVVQISKQTLNFYRETPAPVRVDMVELLEEVLVLYSRRIAEKQLLLTREYNARNPLTVFPGEMRQVFSNLISNAIEASHAGGKLRLRVRSATHWRDGGVRGVRVSVADDGCGIEPKVRPRLGEPFFTTKGESGTGLGLWVTQSILGRYGGNMKLHSSVGDRHGTVFSIFLPTNLRPTILHPQHPGTGSEEDAALSSMEDLREEDSKDPFGERARDRKSSGAA